jgi:anti-sigma B factor antagonist
MTGTLTIETRRLDQLMAIVTLHGEMDLETAAHVKAAMGQLLDEGCHHLIINMRQIEFLDSTGLSVLLGASRRAKERGGGVRLVAPRAHIRRLFHITRLNLALPIDATEQEAVQHLFASGGECP